MVIAQGNRQQLGELVKPIRTLLYLPALVLVLLAFACAGELPLVERFGNETWQPDVFQLASLTGQRDGTEVSFDIELQGEGTRRLSVRGTVVIDPRARFVSGQWVEEGGAEPRSGLVSSATVDFLGGQGGRPSLGGQFTLSAAHSPRYRLNLTTRELNLPAEKR
jgi:hypothetical protein